MKRGLLFIFLLYISISVGQTKLIETSEINQIKKNYELGVSHINNGSFKEAFSYLNVGLNSSNQIKNDSLIAIGNLHLSLYYLLQSKYLESINTANEALSVYQNLNGNIGLSSCYSRLGDIYFKISNFDKSHYFYYEALKIKELLNDEMGIAENLVKIGKIYKITPDPDIDLPKARVNFNKALKIYEKLDFQEGIISSLTSIGAIYLKEGINHSNQEKIIKAIDIFKQTLVKAENLKFVKSQAVLLGNIGPSLRMLNRNIESLDYLFKALEIKISLNDSTSAAHSCNDISETYIAMNDLDNAKKYALKAVDLAKGVSLNQERYAFYLLSEINKNLGDYKNANSDLKQFYKLADSIFSVQKIARINENQIKYETEKKTLRIQAQESDIALLNEKNKVKNQYMIIGTVGLLSMFGFVLLFRSRKKQKQKQQLQEQFSRDLIQSQEDERTRIAKELHDSVGQQLTLIKKKSQNANQDDITSLTYNALEEVRSISRGLYPAMLKQLGLKESIEQLVYEYDEESDLFFTSEIDDIDNLLNEMDSLNFYRFIQECLTNIIKHADAKTVTISIKKGNKNITTVLEDNGKGFNTSAKQNQNSLGLKTIAERISMFKGKLNIESKVGKGTKIFALIPITI